MASSKATGPTVGLDIGSAFIKVVEMRPGRGTPQVVAVGIMPTPANTFAGDVVADPIALGAALKKLLQESGITAKTAVASVSGQANFLMRILPVPKMTDKELVESMRWEVERHVPFRPEETIKDFKALPPIHPSADDKEMSVLLAVGQKQLIDNFAGALLYAGLVPAALDVEPLALVRTVPLREVQDDCVAFVNIGAAKTDIGVFDRGILAYPRTLPIAGNNLTRSVADTMSLPTEQAERLKVEFGEIPEVRAQTTSAFEETGGFGAFDLPDAGTPATAEAADSGLNTPFGAPPEPAQAEPSFGGFATPSDEGDGGMAFTLDDEEAAPAPGGFSFSLDDEPTPPSPAFPPASAPPAPPLSEAPSPFVADSAPFAAAASPFAEDAPASRPPSAGSPVPMSEQDLRRRQITDALVPVFNDLSMEIRRTLEYYVNRPGGRAVQRVYLSGGSARMRGMAHALEQDLGVPVQVEDPSRNFPPIGKAAQPGYYAEIGPVVALAIGLGIRDLVPDPAPPPAPARAGRK